MSFVLGNKLEVVPDFTKEHFRYFDPVRAAGGAEKGLQLVPAAIYRYSLVYFLRGKHQDAVGNIAMGKAQPL